jgi:hypothetical protein
MKLLKFISRFLIVQLARIKLPVVQVASGVDLRPWDTLYGSIFTPPSLVGK